MVDQLVAELSGDLALEPLDLFGLEFDHLAGAQIDQVVVVRFGAVLVACAVFTIILLTAMLSIRRVLVLEPAEVFRG